jgi:hypothetical protein
MAAVATSPVVGVTMTNESNHDHTTGPLQGAQTWGAPKPGMWRHHRVAIPTPKLGAHNPISR